MQNESTSFSESLRGRRSEVERLPAITKLGPVDTAGHTLVNGGCSRKFLPLSGISPIKIRKLPAQLENRKITRSARKFAKKFQSGVLNLLLPSIPVTKVRTGTDIAD
jgi:hypothetical protein